MSMSEEHQAPPTHPAWGVRQEVDPEVRKLQAEIEAMHICPECEKHFATKQALGSHRWGSHKVSGEPRPRKRKPKTVEQVLATNKSTCPTCGKLLLVSSLPKHIARFHAWPVVPETYDVDDIFNAVAGLLFPESIPTKALPELLAWREATQRLLDTLVSF